MSSITTTSAARQGLVATPCSPLVAALFVEDGGAYFDLPTVDPWAEARDARTYPGELPVVAHPPCQLWGNLARVNYARYGGDHNKPGNDGGLFAAAKRAVDTWGGVLEHPAGSWAFTAHDITPPASMGWQLTIEGAWVCEVWQSAYGHRANKATWLYYRGDNPPHQLRWERKVGTHQVGWKFGTDTPKPSLSKREAAATPESFRDELITLAIEANRGIIASRKITQPDRE